MTTLVEAYAAIDEMAKGLRGLVEVHLEKVPNADFNLLMLLDDGGGGTTITHTYQDDDGVADADAALLVLAQAWENIQATGGGTNTGVGLEEIMREARASRPI